MNGFRHFTIVAAVAVAAVAAALLSSCSHGGSGGGSDGATYYGGGLSGSGGSSSGTGGGTTTATYVSYDQAGGYLNIDGGKYQTCILRGNSEGGTITLTDGIKDELTGTYGSASGSGTALAASAVSLAATVSTEIRIEGCWTVTFGGLSRSYSYSVLVTRNLISIRCTGSDGTKGLFTAGAAVSADRADTLAGGNVVPGSADDPFNGTRWGGSLNSLSLFKFVNGTFYRNSRQWEACGPYTVSRTGDGYKVCFFFLEQAASGSNSSRNWDHWSLAYLTLTTTGAGATEADYGTEVTTTYSGSGNAVNGTYDYAQQNGTLYKVTQ